MEGSSLHCLLHHQTRESIVIMSEGLHIGHFQADGVTGRLTEITKVLRDFSIFRIVLRFNLTLIFFY